ncbi:hypothetical protein [Anaerocolumna aminovalerica]|nr:hypothetical protein [Anaerocolumna aminovalerica]
MESVFLLRAEFLMRMAEMDIWSLGVEGNVRVTNTIIIPKL